MILNTGNRTDIPAFYSKWFMNRIHEGFVMARNPYYPEQIIKYSLDPRVIDCLIFCSKNPTPMIEYLSELDDFNQFWFVTITPYGKDIEPNVINKYDVIEATKQLSEHLGKNSVGWRYDPVLINEKYTKEYHVKAFYKIARELSGYVSEVVISFIDLYAKTVKNFPGVKEVSKEDQKELSIEFFRIAKDFGLEIRACLEDDTLSEYGIITGGCMSQDVIERAIGKSLKIKKNIQTRQGCKCLLGNDIGAYNTCGHLCKYCYANYSKEVVIKNMKNHDPMSPLLIGNIQKEDIIKESKQESWLVE